MGKLIKSNFYRNLSESRNGSLVIINNKNQLKNLSRSRPKQRQTKLIDDQEKVSHILKMLENSHKIDPKLKNQKVNKNYMPKILATSEENDPKTERSKGNNYFIK